MINKLTYLIGIATLLLSSCEKEISVDLPRAESKLVVEGSIEQDQAPIIILTKTSGYFDPTDLASVAESFVGDATITISDGTTTNTMTKVCSGSLTPPQQQVLANQLGISLQILQNYNICGYTDAMVGEVGKTYSIAIDWQGETYNSSTTIMPLVPLDSLWFKVQGELDSLGFLWAILSDPITQGGAYRWYAKRINKYTYGPETGQQKDPNFIAPSGSSFDDEFINGITFDFAYNRGGGTQKQDDLGDERGYFKRGDTVVVKFCTIDTKVQNFIEQAENQVQSTGSPFASPSNVPSNISNGALGLWAGYGVTQDTVFCN